MDPLGAGTPDGSGTHKLESQGDDFAQNRSSSIVVPAFKVQKFQPENLWAV